MIKLELPIVTPSNNQLLRKYRHWAVKRRLMVSYMDELMVAMKESEYSNDELLTEGKRECRIISYRKRLLDDDNLAGGMKILLDSIVKMGLLKDDKPSKCKFIPEQKKSKRPHTVVELKDIKEA